MYKKNDTVSKRYVTSQRTKHLIDRRNVQSTNNKVLREELKHESVCVLVLAAAADKSNQQEEQFDDEELRTSDAHRYTTRTRV